VFGGVYCVLKCVASGHFLLIFIAYLIRVRSKIPVYCILTAPYKIISKNIQMSLVGDSSLEMLVKKFYGNHKILTVGSNSPCKIARIAYL